MCVLDVAAVPVVVAYVDAFRLGFRILAGVAVFQFVLCLGLARVVLLDNTSSPSVTQAEEYQLEEKNARGDRKDRVSVGVDEATAATDVQA